MHIANVLNNQFQLLWRVLCIEYSWFGYYDHQLLNSVQSATTKYDTAS